ncbi:MAG: FAD-dependent oxidoreductase [Gammaproteobacteria bacterium]|nr:FAD-dependent oxidoreductase [Gammaproteobacteria bacterium]
MTVVIIGAGQAAGQAAASLRQRGYEGAVVVIGDEAHPPYQRPPLSKQYLAGESGLDRVYMRPASFYAEKDITLKTGTRAVALDLAARTVATDAGESIGFDHLLLATGSRPRRLDVPGSDLAGVNYLRTIADVDAIREAMQPGRRLVIVGAGYIGLEVASVAITAGLEVDVLEMQSRVLQRVTTPIMSSYYERMHSDRGVRIHTRAAVTAFLGNDRVRQVQCGDRCFDADLVLVGIGIVPNVELAADAGLACDNGILVDEYCRTADPAVYAVGDCCNQPHPLLGRRLRLESVPNALEQARVAAQNICGAEQTCSSYPWFWSDQYEHKLQMVGFSADGDEHQIHGDMDAHKFAVFYTKDGKVVALDAVNSPREFMACRQMVAQGVDAATLAAKLGAQS